MLPACFFSRASGTVPPPASPLERVAAAWPAVPSSKHVRKYRADILVTFLGLTVLSRADVGSGEVTIEEGVATGDTRTVGLRFAAGSVPDRARGLNRLGYIHELVIERKTDVVESAYFGFMTASPETSFNEARGALGPGGNEAVPYTAVEGSNRGGNCSYSLYRLLLPGSWNYSNCGDLIRQVRTSLTNRQIQVSKAESFTAVESPKTFLYAMRQAMRSDRGRSEFLFLYNGKHYKLDAEKSADNKTSQHLASKNVISSGVTLLRLNGSVLNQESGEKTPFRLWFEKDSDLPVRFEYKPRSYLNLAFEYVPA
jgi:hypothetical protein